MVFRVYVEKKPGFDIQAKQLLSELKEMLDIQNLVDLRIFNRYDIEGLSEEQFKKCVSLVFSEPQSDSATFKLPDDVLCDVEKNNASVFAVEFLPGQFDQRADSASECIQLVTQGTRPVVASATVYVLKGKLFEDDVDTIKRYLINPIEARLASLEEKETLVVKYPIPDNVEILHGFLDFCEQELMSFIDEHGLAMDIDDLKFCQDYFASENRCPTITEIKMIDTYWSDHCRHTTFMTTFDEVIIDDSQTKEAYDVFLQIKRELGHGDTSRVCLFDIATIGAKYLQHKGILKNLDESKEINACTVKVKCDVDGKEEDWLYLFKNETHNHPTEIEPFGGAATCIGGAIRDPLSGRSYVYQAMRVTGAANPLAPIKDTVSGKIPQHKLVTTAANGYSSYGNQIGIATGQVCELYHPGYTAKRMEIGAVVGAAPKDHVCRKEPQPGDVIVLLGGRTGRDGIGGATGSSKAHKTESLETCGAEVQKGNAVIERKLQRLFRTKKACQMIKRCNDFGAGGVSVAVGELADGLIIELDNIPKKYEGLDGTELAISESQERMAVVLDANDLDEFVKLANNENLEATKIATVTKQPRVKMIWRNETIVDISRDFLASNGAEKHTKIHIKRPKQYECNWAGNTLYERFKNVLTDLNVASNKGLAERFDSTIGAATVLMPYGGKTQLSPSMAMVAKFPVNGETTTCSAMSWGFNPYISEKDQYSAAYLAVIESLSKLVACGFDYTKAYLTFQEYFESLRKDSARWGKPTAALLGALMAQLDFGVGSIGGKDSMSGSFEDLDVPPTLVSFATVVGNIEDVVSSEFKCAGNQVFLISPEYSNNYTSKDLIPDATSQRAVFKFVYNLVHQSQTNKARCVAIDNMSKQKEAPLKVEAITTPGYGCLAARLFEMCAGNTLGVRFDKDFDTEVLFKPMYGSFLIELSGNAENLMQNCEDYDVRFVGWTQQNYQLTIDAQSSSSDDDVQNGNYDTQNSDDAQNGNYDTQSKDNRIQSDNGTQSGGNLNQNDNDTQSSGNDVQNNGDGTQSYSDTSAIDLFDLQKLWEQKMQSVYPYKGSGDEVETISFNGGAPLVFNGNIAKPRVIIPVFPGTNCEYDTAYAFTTAGALPTTLVINNLSANAIAQSITQLANAIKQSQIIVIPGGFSGADEPDGSAKFITSCFRSPEVTQAVQDLLQNRDGLILGICNGFQALIKLGLVPFGDIIQMNEDCPTLTFNSIGRHQSKLVHTRIASSLSPWLSCCKVGEVYTVPISHGEGRFVASDKLLRSLKSSGQIATQYVDQNGVPSMNLDVNPNGSVLAIEGITSPDGRVFGKMGHSERSGYGLYKNVEGNTYQPLFKSGVEYFS